MGLDYSYEIFVPAGGVARALTELSDLAPPGGRVPPLALTLPGGERLTVPFTSGFSSAPVDCSAGGTLDLDTSIMFEVDDTVGGFLVDRDAVRDALGRASIGYIYLTVEFAPARHPRYASLQFTAATTGMSRLFERSASVRAVFTRLTAAAGGVCCVLDTESAVLDVCWLDGRPLREPVPGPRFPDFRDLAASWPAGTP